MNTKNPLQSLTIKSLLVILATMLFRVFKVDLDVSNTQAIINDIIAFWPELLAFVATLTAMWGRWRANAPISMKRD